MSTATPNQTLILNPGSNSLQLQASPAFLSPDAFKKLCESWLNFQSQLPKPGPTVVGLVFEVQETSMSRRLHDLRGSLRTLDLAIKSIADGYRFDDQMADVKIATMTKALGLLTVEAKTLISMLEAAVIDSNRLK